MTEYIWRLLTAVLVGFCTDRGQLLFFLLVKAETGLYSKTSPFNTEHVINSAKLVDNQRKQNTDPYLKQT